MLGVDHPIGLRVGRGIEMSRPEGWGGTSEKASRGFHGEPLRKNFQATAPRLNLIPPMGTFVKSRSCKIECVMAAEFVGSRVGGGREVGWILDG